MSLLDCGGKTLDLSQPLVMGILNVTPDSFSDGGRFLSPAAALSQARRLWEEGAALIDVGGESTRPGAQGVSTEEELARVIPVIQTLAQELPIPISVDTSKAEVMRAAVRAGAGFINDVQALRGANALATAAQLGVPVCLMHMRGEPRTMQANPHYMNLLSEVQEFLQQRIDSCEQAGIPRERLLIDPGFGFGKQLGHNLELLAHLDQFQSLGVPVLIGLSRKSMLGSLTGRPVEQRLAAGLAAAVLAVERGARIVRTHDVAPTLDAIRVTWAVAGSVRSSG